MKLVMLPVLLLLLLLQGASSYASASSEAEVVLTTDNFNAEIVAGGDQTIWLLALHAPWCGHCKALLPRLRKAAEAAQELEAQSIRAQGDVQIQGQAPPAAAAVRFGTVDCTAESAICQRFGVKGYPTLVVLRPAPWRPADTDSSFKLPGTHGWIVHPFLAARSRSELEAFAAGIIVARSQPALKFDVASSNDSEQTLSDALKSITNTVNAAEGLMSFALVTRKGGKDSELARDFRAAGASFGETAHFVELTLSEGATGDDAAARFLGHLKLISGDEETAKLLVGADNFVLAVDPQDNSTLHYVNSATANDTPLGDWLWKARTPLVSPLSQTVFVRMAHDAKPVLAVIPTPSAPNQPISTLHTAGANLQSAVRNFGRSDGQGSFSYVFVDPVQFEDFYTERGLKMEDLPALLMLDPVADIFYVAPERYTRPQEGVSLDRHVELIKDFVRLATTNELEARGPGATWWGWMQRTAWVLPVLAFAIVGTILFCVFVVFYDEDDEPRAVAPPRPGLAKKQEAKKDQ